MGGDRGGRENPIQRGSSEHLTSPLNPRSDPPLGCAAPRGDRHGSPARCFPLRLLRSTLPSNIVGRWSLLLNGTWRLTHMPGPPGDVGSLSGDEAPRGPRDA